MNTKNINGNIKIKKTKTKKKMKKIKINQLIKGRYIFAILITKNNL